MSRLFRRRPFAGLAALVGLGLLAGGCSGGGGGSAAPGGLEKTTLNVVASPAMDSAGLYIAQERGLFAAEGLNVTIQETSNQTAAINSQLAQKFDVTVGNYFTYIRANGAAKHPADFRVLAAGSILQANNEQIMVRQNSNISTISQLVGKHIAVNAPNSMGTLLVSSVLTDNAVQAGQQAHFISIPFNNMATALATRQVDAAWMPEPYVAQAEEKVGAVPLADSDQGTTQSLPISGYMVTASWLKKYPNTAAAFRTAILKAQAIAATDPAAIQQGMVKFAITQNRTAAIANPPQFPTQQNTVLLQRLADLMLKFNMLQQKYVVNPMIVK
jgi:NitT/TauT family transport system substrate-binding protein